MAGRRKAKRGKTGETSAKIRVRREVSAGGIVWRRGAAGAVEMVMIRPHGSEAWALPKGHIEKGENAAQAATREVREETGLHVGAISPLGTVSYVFSWRDRPSKPLTRIFKRVHFFLMEFSHGNTADHDHEIDEVAWMPIDTALRRASYSNERELIEQARARLMDTKPSQRPSA